MNYLILEILIVSTLCSLHFSSQGATQNETSPAEPVGRSGGFHAESPWIGLPQQLDRVPLVSHPQSRPNGGWQAGAGSYRPNPFFPGYRGLPPSTLPGPIPVGQVGIGVPLQGQSLYGPSSQRPIPSGVSSEFIYQRAQMSSPPPQPYNTPFNPMYRTNSPNPGMHSGMYQGFTPSQIMQSRLIPQRYPSGPQNLHPSQAGYIGAYPWGAQNQGSPLASIPRTSGNGMPTYPYMQTPSYSPYQPSMPFSSEFPNPMANPGYPPFGQSYIGDSRFGQPTRRPDQTTANSTVPTELTGVWGTWAAWSSCSMTCNGGVARRTRSCIRTGRAFVLSLYMDESDHACRGSRVDYQACNTQPCDPRAQESKKYESRERQCRGYNDKSMIEGVTHDWIPYMKAGLNECELNCMAKGQRFYARLAPQVENGTPCGTGDDVCKDGKCVKAESLTKDRGEDGESLAPPSNPSGGLGTSKLSSYGSAVLNSPPRQRPSFDRKKVHQRYIGGPHLQLGVNPIFRLPVGSSNINITETVPSRNSIGLRGSGGIIFDGSQNYKPILYFPVSGAVFIYSRDSASKDTLFSRGPITEELEVLIIFARDVVDLEYSFSTIGSSDRPPLDLVGTPLLEPNPKLGKNVTYQWKAKGFGECSKSCDAGEQELQLECVVVDHQGTFIQAVNTSLCQDLNEIPMTKRVCNMNPCSVKWVPVGWQSCNVSCGTGVQERILVCVKDDSGNGTDLGTPVSDESCSSLPRPTSTQTCSPGPCHMTWSVGSWSTCSVSCGTGVQTRTASCIDENNNPMPTGSCPGESPPVQRACDLGSCNLQWFVSETWSQCSAVCGSGLKYRHVFCTGTNGSQTDDIRCSSKPKPASQEECRSQPCTGVWLTSSWDECFGSCPEGVQIRMVFCAGLNSKDGLTTRPDGDCDQLSRPADRRPCFNSLCHAPVWATSNWSECPSTCEVHTQTREVTCLYPNGTYSVNCRQGDRPANNRPCHLPATCTTWTTTPSTPSPATMQQSTEGTTVGCEDTYANGYCSVIHELNFCQTAVYRDKCCKTCSGVA